MSNLENNEAINKEAINKEGLHPFAAEHSLGADADAQIQAHRAQHQQKMKQLLFLGVGLLLVVLISAVAYSWITKSESQTYGVAQTNNIVLSQEDIQAFRDSFKQALTTYELDIQPRVDEMVFVAFAPAKLAELSFMKESLLSSFARADYAESKAQLDILISRTEALISEWQQAFENQLLNATQQFEKAQIPQAQVHLNQALGLMPNNNDALALQARIDAFGEIASLLDDLEVAKIERNLPKQINLLNNIVSLDPASASFNNDLTTVKSEYKEQQLAQALSKAEQAITKGRLKEASTLIAQAKNIKPDSKGAQSLTQRIQTLRSEQSLEAAKMGIEQAIAQDAWGLVKQLSETALKNFPNDASLRTSKQKAIDVLTANRTLDDFIRRPARLADENIRSAAATAMQKAFGASLHSPSLKSKIAEVGDIVDSFSQPVDVTIASDAKTYIIVVGVGHVGEHKEKTIQLTPGKYVLEGRRDGYRNKRMAFEVLANTPTSLALVCDEKLQTR